MTSKHRDKKGNLQYLFEEKFIAEKKKDFDPYLSDAWKQLTIRYGPKISHGLLLSMAEVVSHHLQIELFREYKRRKEMLIKWFDEQLDIIIPFLDNHFTMIDSNGNIF